MIDFNEAIIIQMTFDHKMSLRDMLETALKNRAQLQGESMASPENKYSSAQHLDSKENDLMILQMRQNHNMKKFAVQEEQKFCRKMSSGVKMSRVVALGIEYDFYLKNNQGMFVEECQLKYLDFKKLNKTKNIKSIMTSVPDFKVIRQELQQESENYY